ncbi:TRAP-type mannitol/chloroaromatic compound transport system, periplasmic component [Oligella ureolytica]|uniref:TRAP transporter substrate-binding protein n=1 Tax=Oligella ureolytica TaxID=90244 RepID=UPI000E00C0D8|nr:TRAP transporter substrate-binding protein [Oligella ureolytica]SUA51251.1 TRAP-type mannitol/chloroaromatic compound transport system, periplasmic component [Oligella ureolytica]
MKKCLSTVVLALTLGLAAQAQAATYRMAMVTHPTHNYNKVSEKMNTELKELSDNKNQIRIFPLSQLGTDSQVITTMQTGGIQLAVLTATSLSTRVPEFNAWSMPFIIEDIEHAASAAQSDSGKEMLSLLDAQGLVGIGYVFAGMRQVLSVKPVNSVDDFKNMKIRSVPSEAYSDFWRKLGAAPTALDPADISSALTTNLLDAVDADLDLAASMKYQQQAPNLILTNHMPFPGVVVASKRWWDKLSDKDKQDVLTAFERAESWGVEQQIQAESNNLEALLNDGANRIEIDLTSLHQVGEEMVQDYAAKYPLIEKFYDENKR